MTPRAKAPTYQSKNMLHKNSSITDNLNDLKSEIHVAFTLDLKLEATFFDVEKAFDCT